LKIRSEVYLIKRPSIDQLSEFVSAAGSYDSEIYFCQRGVQVNGKGMLGVNLFFLSHFTENKKEAVTLEVEGSDAENAIHHLTALLQN
jgi:phosphotransferase system HPr (HPr) family protein